MAKLISKLNKSKEDYLSVVAEIEDNATSSVKLKALKIIEEVMIHEEIALDFLTLRLK